MVSDASNGNSQVNALMLEWQMSFGERGLGRWGQLSARQSAQYIHECQRQHLGRQSNVAVSGHLCRFTLKYHGNARLTCALLLWNNWFERGRWRRSYCQALVELCFFTTTVSNWQWCVFLAGVAVPALLSFWYSWACWSYFLPFCSIQSRHIGTLLQNTAMVCMMGSYSSAVAAGLEKFTVHWGRTCNTFPPFKCKEKVARKRTPTS